MFVSFGNASGAIDAFNILLLQTKGSLFASRPTLVHYGARREDVVTMAKDLMDVVSKGVVKIPVNQSYALKDVAQAHMDLESRKTTGSTVLIP
jgi:NADPH2:quinone reductase